MGRWSQSRRTGGGPGSQNFIVTAHIQDTLTARITYSREVAATSFNPPDFSSAASGEVGEEIAQVSPTVIDVTFEGPIAADENLTFDGAAGDVRSPQTIAYT